MNRIAKLSLFVLAATWGLTAVAATPSVSGASIGVGSSSLVDSGGNVWTLPDESADENGSIAGGNFNTILVLYYNRVIYCENTSDEWYSWNGSGWVRVSGDPVKSKTASASANGASIGVGTSSLVDSGGNVWTLPGESAEENGSEAGDNFNTILALYYNNIIYCENTSGEWYSWSGSGWIRDSGDPRGSGGISTSSILEFVKSATSADQSSSSVQLTIERTAGSNGDASVHYQTKSGAAVAGVNFSTDSGDLTWANGDATTRVINVSLLRGTASSTPISFSVSLSDAAGASLGSPSTEEVTINPPSQIAMSATSYTATQGGGHVNVQATRTGDTSGAAAAQFTTSNNTAVAGTQYTSVVSTLTWAAGDATAHTVTIPVMSTPAFSGTKNFNVALTAPTGATLGSTTTAAVTIVGSSSSTGGTTATSGLYVYQNHSGTGPNGTSSLWDGDFSFGSNGPVVGTDTTHPETGHKYDLKIPGGVNGIGGGMAWMPVGSYATGIPDGSGKGPFGFDMSPYTWITFDIWTAFPGDDYDMLFEYLGNFPAGTADQGSGSYIDNLVKVPGVALNASGWTTVKLPISSFGQLGIKGVYKFYIRDNTAGASQVFYLDNVGFLPGNHSFIYDGGAPNGFNATTNTWTNDPSTLLNGWVDASSATMNYNVSPSTLTALQSKVSLNGMTKPGIGTTSTNCISMVSTTAGGMWKVTNPGFALSSYTYFTFGALPTSGTHSYSVQFYDTSGAAIGSPVSVTQNSTFTTREWNQNGGRWTIYSIPLSTFGTLPAQIGGMSIKDTSGLAANTIYLSAPAFFN